MGQDLTGRKMTPQQAKILDLKNGARWTFRQIADALDLTPATVHQHYRYAMAKAGATNYDLSYLPTSVDRHEWRRIEESEFIDARIRDYLDIKEKALDANPMQLRNAIEALNGAHKYMETLIKLQGISAPEKREVAVTVDDLRKELQQYEAEDGPITEAEILEFTLTESSETK